MPLQKIDESNIDSLLEGLAILGTGGGGSPEWGKKIMLRDFKKGRKYHIISPGDVEDDATVVSGGIMGSVKTLENMCFNDLLEYWEDNYVLEKAYFEMEKEIGKKIDYIVAFEMGGLNTPAILSLGARRDIPVIDGDALGRAAPETQMTSFMGHGIKITPMPLVDHKGNVVVVRKTDDPVFPDKLGRWIVTRGGGLGANNHYLMNGKELKKSVIPNTISKAVEIGNSIIEAKKNNRNPIDSFLELTSGIDIFSGKISSLIEEEDQGFYFTRVKLKGIDDFKGDVCELIIKNETMICWKNGKVQAIFPDLLCILEPETGRGLMSVELERGRELRIIALPCHSRLREVFNNPNGRIAFSPKRYGQNLEYFPLEELH